MRTKEEIRYSLDKNLEKSSQMETGIAFILDSLLEVAIDIRDLLNKEANT